MNKSNKNYDKILTYFSKFSSFLKYKYAYIYFIFLCSKNSAAKPVIFEQKLRLSQQRVFLNGSNKSYSRIMGTLVVRVDRNADQFRESGAQPQPRFERDRDGRAQLVAPQRNSFETRKEGFRGNPFRSRSCELSGRQKVTDQRQEQKFGFLSKVTQR